ncbi:hypothetical protein [Serratia marcescens]|uniref:hypothetical protein n=1 Tax=Serratia marcescens TaxID=615 RepID=UPI0015E1B25A|nr:hypothetical protein [Serratia marcescens]WLS86876.1 hypothetical protein RAM09_18745 [Serratia marcescens]
MTTIKRFTPDYKMHAVRFEAFAREAEHGELVRFDAHQQVVSTLEAERDAQQKRADALAVENASMREALDSIRIYSSDTLSGPSDSVPDMAAWLREGVEHLHQVSIIETPATDAALAAIHARFCELLDTYGKVEPERFNPEFADLYAKIANRIFSSVMDNPHVIDIDSMTEWLEISAVDARAYADMSIKFHAELREAK